MTDTFDKRAKAFENKQSHKEALHFKNKVEAVRRLGFWASKQLGFDDQTLSDYTQNLIDNCFVTGGLKAVVKSVAIDFDEYGFDQDEKSIDHKVRTYLAELDAEDGISL